MSERSVMISWIRSELVGPSFPLTEPTVVGFSNRDFVDPVALRRGPLAWLPDSNTDLQEVIYFDRESPYRKYGAGLLHPFEAAAPRPDEVAAQASDSVGAEPGDNIAEDFIDSETDDGSDEDDFPEGVATLDDSDDFEVTSADIRYPSTIGISFCVRFDNQGEILVKLPQSRHFSWQDENVQAFQLNGRYELCERQWTDQNGGSRQAPIWRRLPALPSDTEIKIDKSELVSREVLSRDLSLPEGSPLSLRLQIFPRLVHGSDDIWLITVILSNRSPPVTVRARESVLYQSFFEVEVNGGGFEKYPESQRQFEQFDQEEKSLALLYREAATWGIGHGCAAGWEVQPGKIPETVFADVMPAVELPSMTPDIEVDGIPIRLSMRDLSELPDDGSGPIWKSLDDLATGYAKWIQVQRDEAAHLPANLAQVATINLNACDDCLGRITSGIAWLRSDPKSRRAFRLANLTMLLQQIVTKQIDKRSLAWDEASRLVMPSGQHQSPWDVYENNEEDTTRLGSWRAFQIAFLLMSLKDMCDGELANREIVDLIWFPTGGGKTEAYLAVMAFYMFHERLLIGLGDRTPARDGTNVLMRYTLRMLTTQQFQRAASLICAMEYVRRNAVSWGWDDIPGRRFSLGLWVGGEGSPNKKAQARVALRKFQRGTDQPDGNPLVLTECPWCKAEIGRFDGPMPRLRPPITATTWNALRTRGITDDPQSGPLLLCPDRKCEFGQESLDSWLPVEVIDERIYEQPPSLVIATADKLAIIAYRPEAGALFGRQFVGNELRQESRPPGLIIQDELHLISGPLGTMYALYEGVIERLCSLQEEGVQIKPKIIASTATIRGAADQVNALYDRQQVQLFPSPALSMGDSFFGKYARDESGKLLEGRLYLGVHASDYGSILTAQVRSFAAALFCPWSFDSANRDPWWTLLAFYNSIRELGGARTLFDSDIRSRLKFLFNREGYAYDDRRNLNIVEELTSRLTQTGIVQMMDRLSLPYRQGQPRARGIIDACLASSIIEVGVDIDRLSLMGVVGQPKTTASYIQVTGRVGRRWWERPGLVLMIYSPSKSRDRSHFEQFHSYHRRLYERVEPTTATPFAVSAIERGLAGALIAWARQHCNAGVNNKAAYMDAIESGYQLLLERCENIQVLEDQSRSLEELRRVRDQLIWKWEQNPQAWEEFPQKVDGEYLMLWPGQYASSMQQKHGQVVPSSMRQVDRSAELTITQAYAAETESDGPQDSGDNNPTDTNLGNNP